MTIRNILICTTQVPFTTGGASRTSKGSGAHSSKPGTTPRRWRFVQVVSPEEIMRGALAWRMLDLSEANGKPVDLVVGMKFPPTSSRTP